MVNDSGEIVDVVSGNNLSVQSATGAGFIASTPIVDLNIDEHTTNGTQVGYVIPTDSGSDAAESFTFALLDDASGRFAIDANTGEITVADASQLDFEANSSHDINVEVTGADNISYNEVVTIIVNDLNDSSGSRLTGTGLHLDPVTQDDTKSNRNDQWRTCWPVVSSILLVI